MRNAKLKKAQQATLTRGQELVLACLMRINEKARANLTHLKES